MYADVLGLPGPVRPSPAQLVVHEGPSTGDLLSTTAGLNVAVRQETTGRPRDWRRTDVLHRVTADRQQQQRLYILKLNARQPPTQWRSGAEQKGKGALVHPKFLAVQKL